MREGKLEELNNIIEELKAIEFNEVKEGEKWDWFIKSIPYRVKLNNGAVIPREEIVKGGNKKNAVIVVPILENGEILTVIEPRVFCELTVGVGIPMGFVEDGENPEMGALRELKEETGYEPETLELVDSFYQDQGCSSLKNYVYIARGCKKVSEQNLDEFEIIKYMQFTYDELRELEKMEYIMGGNTKLALLRYKENI